MGNWKGRGKSGFLEPFGYSFFGPTPVAAREGLGLRQSSVMQHNSEPEQFWV